MRPKLTVTRKAHKRAGKRVKAVRYKIKDRGKPGRAPKAERWFDPQTVTGWRKTDPQAVRIRNLVKSHKGDLLAAARSAQALANVTTDSATERKARADAKALFRAYHKSKKGGAGSGIWR